MKTVNYREYCEELYIDWLNDNHKVDKNFGFELKALPEPYLTFGDKADDFAFLTSNPGSVNDFQLKPSDFLKSGESYYNLSKRLSDHYDVFLEENSKTQPVTRITKMKKLRERMAPSQNGFTQFEISPFHSSNFKKKKQYAKYLFEHENSFYKKYSDLLKAELKEKNCVCIQGGYPDLGRLNKNWLKLLSYILSVDSEQWKSVDFKIKNNRATTGAFYHKKNNRYKVIIFNAAGNSLPVLESMDDLFEVLEL